MKFKNNRGLNLNGDLYKASSESIVLLVHGFLSDKRSSGRFEYIAERLTNGGYNAFAFDFAGCGESDDDNITVDKHIEDLRSAIAFVQSLGFKRLALWGHSLGSRICLQSYSSDVSTMVLTGALLGPVNYEWDNYFSAQQLDDIVKTGKMIVPYSHELRKQIIVDAQMLKDFAIFDQKNILSKIKCPVLIINGNQDAEEIYLAGIAKDALRYLTQNTVKEIIPGADHTFTGFVDRLTDLGLSWLDKYLQA